MQIAQMWPKIVTMHLSPFYECVCVSPTRLLCGNLCSISNVCLDERRGEKRGLNGAEKYVHTLYTVEVQGEELACVVAHFPPCT